MNKITLTLVLSLIVTSVFGQDSMYEKTMKKNIDSLYAAKKIADYQKVANSFEIVAVKENDKWLPLYYVAFSKILMSYAEKDAAKKDVYLDDAQKSIDKAFKISDKEDELYVLQGMLHQARISVSPMSRGQKYSILAEKSFNEASVLNPDNPRIYYLRATNILHTPKMYGGGKEKALPYFQKAKEKYDKFTLLNELMPNWGKERNERNLQYCLK